MTRKLGVFITTHITEPEDSHHRHGPDMMSTQLERFERNVIKGYSSYNSGYDICTTINICDTGSTISGFDKHFEQWKNLLGKSISGGLSRYKIPNNCGAFAALKYVMHVDPEEMEKHDYYLFHVDDGTRVTGRGWAEELITQYDSLPSLGVMGRLSETIRLGPAGLVDHRNVCSHIATIHDILWVREVPHLHADYWFMNQKTLKGMAECWNDPIFSQEAMDYQLKYEQMDFRKVWELDKSRRILDNIHIGREVDMPLRIKHFLNLDTATFNSNLIMV